MILIRCLTGESWESQIKSRERKSRVILVLDLWDLSYCSGQQNLIEVDRSWYKMNQPIKACKKLRICLSVSEWAPESVSWFNEADPQDDQPKTAHGHTPLYMLKHESCKTCGINCSGGDEDMWLCKSLKVMMKEKRSNTRKTKNDDPHPHHLAWNG